MEARKGIMGMNWEDGQEVERLEGGHTEESSRRQGTQGRRGRTKGGGGGGGGGGKHRTPRESERKGVLGTSFGTTGCSPGRSGLGTVLNPGRLASLAVKNHSGFSMWPVLPIALQTQRESSTLHLTVQPTLCDSPVSLPFGGIMLLGVVAGGPQALI